MRTVTPLNATTSCFGNNSSDVATYMNNKRLNQVYKVWQGLIPLPTAVIGFIFSIIYILAVCRAIRKRRVSRKCYVLLINKAIGDAFASLVAILMGGYTNIVSVVEAEVMRMFDVFFFCSFWTALVSYVALSLIKLYAVWQPLNYRKKVTMRRCIWLIVFGWVIFCLMISCTLTVIALVRVPFLNEWSGCRVETCIRYMYQVRNSAVVCIYFTIIICFVVTVALLRRARKFVRNFHQPKSENIGSSTKSPKRRSLKVRFPLWKLTLNVTTFAFFNCFYVIWAIVLLTTTSGCFFLRHFELMMLLLGLVRISLLIRIVADPVLAFITDIQIRQSTMLMFGLTRKEVVVTDSRKRVFCSKSESLEENSSETDLQHLNRHNSRTASFRPTYTFNRPLD